MSLPSNRFPLTPIQHRFFELNLRDKNRFAQAVLLETDNSIDFQRLQMASAALMSRHDALRLRFSGAGQDCWQSSRLSPLPFVRRVRLENDSRENLKETVSSLIDELQDEFDLGLGVLWGIVLLESYDRHQCSILFVAHHLVVDIVSWGILLTSLRDCLVGKPQPLLAFGLRPASYTEWATTLESYSRTTAMRSEIPFWSEQDWNATFNPFGTLAPTPNPSVLPDTHRSALTSEETSNLLRWASHTCLAQPSELVLAGVRSSFLAITGGRSVVMAIEAHGREPILGANVLNTVGWFTAIYPFCLDGDPSLPPREAVVLLRDRLRSVPNGGIGYGILRYLGAHGEVSKRLRQMPSSQVCFNYAGTSHVEHSQHPTPSSEYRLTSSFASVQAARFYLVEIVGRLDNGVLRIDWTYRRDAVPQPVIAGAAERCLAFLRSALTCESNGRVVKPTGRFSQ